MPTRSILFFGLLTVFGCTPSPMQDGEGIQDTPDGVHFDLARIYLPHGSDRKNPGHLLAPIIIHESPVNGKTGAPPLLDFEGNKPRVRLLRSEVELNGVTHPQLTYSWEYGKTTTGSPALRPERFLRMTLDSRGYPAVYEIYTEEGRLGNLHVSLALEQAAAREYGPPLPGRKYSVETARRDSGEAGLSGVVEEPPEALGPLVYLDSPGREIVALTCRCSPSKTARAEGSHHYELVELEPGRGEPGNGLPPPARALQGLRLPGEF